MKTVIYDNGGRRDGFDRRKMASPIDFPERRSDTDRRRGMDRRTGYERRSPEGFRSLLGIDRRKMFKIM